MDGRICPIKRSTRSRLIMPEPEVYIPTAEEVAKLGRGELPPIAGGTDSYEISFTSAAVTAAGVLAEILNSGAATNPRMRISEIDVFWAAGASTSISFGLGRPGNTPAGGAATVAVADDPQAPAAFGGYITTGWTTAPTVPAKYMRQAAIASSGGNGIVWSWPMGGELVVPPNARNNGLVLWCTAIGSATSTTLNVTVRWSE